VAIVQGSADQGAIWQVLDQYAEPGLNYAHNRAFAADPLTGALFAGGNLNGVLPNGTTFDALWFIREWDPATRQWTTIDDSSALANDVGQASCADILVAPNGDVYATGGGQLGTGVGWVVRKRAVGSSVFTTVDADYSGKTSGSGTDIAFHSNYGVFVAGDRNGYWTVRRSSSGALGTWQTVDTFQTRRDWGNGSAFGMTVAPSGNIFVAGRAYNFTTGKQHWVVRSSADGGATWGIADNVTSPAGTFAEALGIVSVCGRADGGNGHHWIVRRGQQVQKTSTQKGKTVTTLVWEWSTIDDYQVAVGKGSRANAITADALGNIYVSGNGLDANGVEYFIVRKLPAQ
jgi:WD40 repeat protein